MALLIGLFAWPRVVLLGVCQRRIVSQGDQHPGTPGSGKAADQR